MRKYVWGAAGLLFWGAVSFGGEFTFVKDGTASCRIEAGDSAGEKDFLRIVNEGAAKVSGTGLTAPAGTKRVIRTKIDPALDPEGFVFSFPDAETLLVRSGGEWGMRYAAREFLERYFGIRWLFPGKPGEYIPKKSTVTAPTRTVAQAPHFLTRFFQGGSYQQSKEYYDWTICLKGQVMNRRLEQGHNLWRLLPVAKYGKTHPEFYPVRNGKRVLPSRDIYWNPCFTAPGIADEVAKNVIAALDRAPALRTVSLAVNDGGGFCNCKNCLAVDGNTRNGFGSPHRTRSYLLFLNRVAETVCRKHPNVKFGFIAYGETAEAVPGIKLHPALVPVFTYDRHQLMEPARKKQFLKRVEAWRKCSSSTGNYDYIYGSTYALPRIYFHLMAQYLKEGYAAGERHYINEYMPGNKYPDAPKLYLGLKLAWDTSLDPDSVLDEWYRCVAGPKGAPALKEYFTRLENFWTGNAVRTTRWFSRDRTYLSWDDPSFLAALEETELNKLESLLVEAEKQAESPARVRFFLDDFRSRMPKIRQFMVNRRAQLAAEKLVFDSQLANFDFNTPNSGWGHWQEMKQGSFSVDSAGGVEGSGALCIHNAVGIRSSMCFLRGFPVVPGRVYRLSVLARARDLPEPYGNITMSARFQLNNKWLSSTYNVDAGYKYDGKSEWVPLSLTVTAPQIPGCNLCVLLGNGRAAGGEVWFDNFRLEGAVRPPEEQQRLARTVYVTRVRENFASPRIRMIHAANGKCMKNVPGAGENKTGAYVFDASGAGAGGICCFNIYKVNSGKPCRVRIRYRTEGLPKNAVVELALKWQNGRPAWIAHDRNLSIILPHSETWRTEELGAIAPAEADCRVLPMLSLSRGGKGKLYLDEIAVDCEK